MCIWARGGGWKKFLNKLLFCRIVCDYRLNKFVELWDEFRNWFLLRFSVTTAPCYTLHCLIMSPRYSIKNESIALYSNVDEVCCISFVCECVCLYLSGFVFCLRQTYRDPNIQSMWKSKARINAKQVLFESISINPCSESALLVLSKWVSW